MTCSSLDSCCHPRAGQIKVLAFQKSNLQNSLTILFLFFLFNCYSDTVKQALGLWDELCCLVWFPAMTIDQLKQRQWHRTRREVSEWQHTLGHLQPPGALWLCRCSVGPLYMCKCWVTHCSPALCKCKMSKEHPGFLFFLSCISGDENNPCKEALHFPCKFSDSGGFVPHVCAAGPLPGAELEATLTCPALRATPVLVNHRG